MSNRRFEMADLSEDAYSKVNMPVAKEVLLEQYTLNSDKFWRTIAASIPVNSVIGSDV